MRNSAAQLVRPPAITRNFVVFTKARWLQLADMMKSRWRLVVLPLALGSLIACTEDVDDDDVDDPRAPAPVVTTSTATPQTVTIPAKKVPNLRR